MAPTKKQLANLKRFTEETAREMGARGGKKKKENEPKRKAIEQIKNEIIEKSFSKVYELLDKEDVNAQELIAIFKSAIDMSGFKTNKQEVSGVSPANIIINREMVQVESNNK